MSKDEFVLIFKTLFTGLISFANIQNLVSVSEEKW